MAQMANLLDRLGCQLFVKTLDLPFDSLRFVYVHI